MKKIVFFLLAVCMSVSFANAQTDGAIRDDQSGRLVRVDENKPLHPTAGDIAIGLEATPILNFVGNMFNGTQDQLQQRYWNARYLVNMRYYIFDNLAVRASVGFNPHGFSYESYTGIVPDDAARLADPTSTATVHDVMKHSENDWLFSAGAMMFRGKNRLRGFYGGDFMWQIKRETVSYVYGNKMDATIPTPNTTTSFTPSTAFGPMSTRPLEKKGGLENIIGLTGFAGVEYYFIPQICLGFEVGARLSMRFKSTGTTLTEYMNGTNYTTEETELPDARTRIAFNTESPFYGSFFLMFHF